MEKQEHIEWLAAALDSAKSSLIVTRCECRYLTTEEQAELLFNRGCGCIKSVLDERAKEVTKKIYDQCLQIKQNNPKSVIFLQAMPAPVKKIQTKYRYQILTRYLPSDTITAEFYSASDLIEKDVSIFVETNPNSLR